jgi:hypothetical protein
MLGRGIYLGPMREDLIISSLEWGTPSQSPNFHTAFSTTPFDSRSNFASQNRSILFSNSHFLLVLEQSLTAATTNILFYIHILLPLILFPRTMT